jgi:hypothetical protein
MNLHSDAAPSNSPEIPDSPHLAKPTPEATPPRKPRTRKPPDPRPGQTGLGLADTPKPDAVAELLAEHDRLRRAAQVRHGKQATPLPGRSSKAGQALRDRLAAAVQAHGVEVCRKIIEHRGREWLADVGQLAWSVEQPWSPKSIEHTIKSMAGPAARASPGTLPVPAQLPDRPLPGFTWTPPT